MRRRAAFALASALLVLVPASVGAGGADEPSELFRHPATGAEFRILRDPATGRKTLVAPDGATFDSVDAAVAAEDARLPDHRRLLDPSLWPAAEDPARAGEPVRVALVLRRQPVRDASLEARPRARAEARARLESLRRILSRIAGDRSADADRRMRLGERIEEEASLLSPSEREECLRLRREVLDIQRAMRREILDAARPLADADHAEVAALLAGIPGARVLETSLGLSTVTAEVPAGRLRGLVDDLPSVARVLPSGQARLSTDTSVGAIGAGSWTGGGTDGAGVKVGIVDSGIDGSHPALDGAVVAAASFPDKDSNGTPYGTDDGFGHGTHVGGTVGSRDGTYKGVAPGASLINARCFIGISAFSYWIWRAADFAVVEGADVLNCSFGSPGTTDGTSSDSIFFDAIAADLGISVAAAAGNNGQASSLLRPSDGFNILCVSNFNDRDTVSGSDDVFNSGSSQGPPTDGRHKPDLAAPGTNITSCAYDWEGSHSDWATMTGTSMATPHTAGALALLVDYAAAAGPEGLRALLLANTRIGSPVAAPHDASWGWGALDLASAWTNRASVAEGTFTSSGESVAWLKAPSMAAGQRVFLCWGRDASYTSSTFNTSYRAPVDLDVEVYDSATGALLGRSARTLDTVEAVFLSAASSAPLIKVKRTGTFPSGQSSVDWALALDAASAPAAASGPSIPSAPEVALSFGTSSLRIGESTDVHVTIRNGGPYGIPGPRVTLELPGGVGFETDPGDADLEGTRTVGNLAPDGGEETASWRVFRPPGPGGTLVFRAKAEADAFGESLSSGWIEGTLEADRSPWGRVTIADGSAFTRESPTLLAVDVVYSDGPVTHMRVRLEGEEFGPWALFSQLSLWPLGDGVGTRTLFAQLRDEEGRESVELSDSVFLDAEAPTGSFGLAGGAEYLMPWQPLVADVTADDGAGTGLESLRVRWVGPSGPGPWSPYGYAPPVILERPAAEDARAEAQLLDLAGNFSGILSARIRLVPADAPALTAARSFRGTLGPDGDLDGFRLGTFAGDVVTVKVKTPKGAPAVPLAVDLFDPSGEKVAAGRYPEDGATVGISKYEAILAGEHWLVLRAESAVPDPGLEYSLLVKVKRSREARRRSGTVPVAAPGPVEVPFDGVEGAVLTGRLRGVLGPPLVRSPDGGLHPIGGAPGRDGSWRIPKTVLEGGSGTFTLVVVAEGELSYDLRLKPPKPGKLVEAEE